MPNYDIALNDSYKPGLVDKPVRYKIIPVKKQ